jgi:arylsulfatase A-like enzyme
MLRRHFLGALSARFQPSPARPNFVVIVTDDQGIGDLGCYGHPDVRTPHLDRLASSGIRFTQWYANAPVCSASRAAILTGKYPDRTGVRGALPTMPRRDIPGLRPNETTLPALLRQRGYRTAAIGKWHLGSAPHSRPLAQGFDEFFGFYAGWLDSWSHTYYQLGSPPGRMFHDLWRNETEVFEEPAYLTHVLAREARAFLQRQSAAQPFCLYLCFGAPHYAMQAPRDVLQRFPESMPRDRRTHLAMVAAVDDAVGAITADLRQRGLLDNTVLWFQSDNGATREARASSLGEPYDGGSNRPYRGYKLGLFDGGMHVPAILHAPAVLKSRGVAQAAGRVESRPALSMDLLPTFLDLATPAQPAPPGLDGQSLLPQLRGESPHRDTHFWSHDQSRAVRQGDWKLILNPPQFPGEPVPDRLWLSNLEADPAEQRNLATAEPARAAGLLRRIRDWERYVELPPAPDTPQ